MTTMVFDDATIPDDIPPDSIPGDMTDVEFPCEVCGQEAGPYGGRGRKPKRCAEHKRNGVKSTRKVTGAPATLAAQATASLVQLNSLLAMGAMAFGLFDTAGAIAQWNPRFEEQAYQALITDSELCKLILKGGGVSAKFSLLLAYGGGAMVVGPVAYMEMKKKTAERAERKAAEQGE